MFAAEAISRGCRVFFPLGGATEGVDLLVVTPTRRTLSVQVKAQATSRLRTVGLVNFKWGPPGKPTQKARLAHPPDLLALFHRGDEWYLLPARALKGCSTISVKKLRASLYNWDLIL